MILPYRLPRMLLAGPLQLCLLLAAAATCTAAAAQPAPPVDCTGPASATWLNVTIQGVRSGSGLVAITLYADDSSRFLAKHGSLYTGRVPATAGTTQACIFVPKPGTYAIASYHDENASRKLDRNAIGLPREGFGFSNNPGTFAGIPAFRAVRLAVPRANLATHITLRYP